MALWGHTMAQSMLTLQAWMLICGTSRLALAELGAGHRGVDATELKN
jgi:hypothetical protein